MKMFKKFSKPSLSILLMLFVIYYLSSCSQSSKVEEASVELESNSNEKSDEHSHEATEADHMEETEGQLTWMAPSSVDNIFSRDFHMGAGSADDLKAEVLTEVGGDNMMVLNLSGNTVAFVFHSKYGNSGGEATFKLEDYTGNLKFVYHFKDKSNYEFVSIKENTMELGRVVDGNKKVLDSKGYQLDTSQWNTLRFSAAGEHFKGYLNDEMITHGHDEEMEPGFVGIMLDGTGTLMLKSISVVDLND